MGTNSMIYVSAQLNKYDTYISKAKVLMNQYHNSNQSPSIIIPPIPMFCDSNISSPKHKNVLKIQPYTTISNSLNNTTYNKVYSYSNSINNSICPKKSKTKQQKTNNKRRELILSLNDIDNPLLTHKSNTKPKSLHIEYEPFLSNVETPIHLNKEHISRKSAEIANMFTHINTNEKLNSHLERVFGNEYIHKLINSNVNDGFIEKIQKEMNTYINHNNNNNYYVNVTSTQMNKQTESYADKLLNWNNKYNISNINNGRTSTHSVNNNTLMKTFETTKSTSVFKKQKHLNKTVSTFKHKRKLK